MLNLTFSAAEIAALRTQRFEHPHPLVQLKMEALYLLSQGLKPEEIIRICALSKATYYRYLKEYQERGVARLKELLFYQPQSELLAHRQTLEAYFLSHPPSSGGEACAKIQDWTGIERKPTPVRVFLHSLGLKPRTVGAIPAKADVQAQEEFRKQVWSRV